MTIDNTKIVCDNTNMKRKLIFQKAIDKMLATPDDLHKKINGRVVAKEWNELSELEQERHFDWMMDSATE